MSVAVLVPWSPRCPHREQAWEWVQARYAEHHPDWQLITGTTDVEGFSRTQAILDARSRTDADLLVIADADVWCDRIPDAIDAATEVGWAVPHLLLHRLSQGSTRLVLDGADWRGLPLSDDNPQDRRPYRGNETGTLVVLRSDVFDTAPPDPRFVRWGSEDVAWSLALRTLVGPPWRGGADLVHLWHPAEPRLNRVVGNPENRALLRRYQRARRKPHLMRQLVEEAS